MRNPKKMILLEPIGPYKSVGTGHFYPCQNSTILNLTFVRKVTFIMPMMISVANKKTAHVVAIMGGLQRIGR